MLSVRNLTYSYDKKSYLKFKDISLEENSELLILGGSGKGKTTLLHLIGGLLSLQNGDIIINELNYKDLNKTEIDRFRGDAIGMVFQKPHLISALNVVENLLLSQSLANQKKDVSLIELLLENVGMIDKIKANVTELSVGQAQRVSLVRAMMNSPKLILADEPTSSLDDENADEVMNLLQDYAAKNKAILLISTHDRRVKNRIENQYSI